MIKRLLRKLIKPDHCDECGKEVGWFYGRAISLSHAGIQTELLCLDCYGERYHIRFRRDV